MKNIAMVMVRSFISLNIFFLIQVSISPVAFFRLPLLPYTLLTFHFLSEVLHIWFWFPNLFCLCYQCISDFSSSPLLLFLSLYLSLCLHNLTRSKICWKNNIKQSWIFCPADIIAFETIYISAIILPITTNNYC